MNIVNLRTEYKVNPLGIETFKPRLSWELISDQRNTLQTAYRIIAAGSEADLLSTKNLLWDSLKVNSDQSIHVEYNGTGLWSGQRIYWQVRVWDNHGHEVISQIAWWEMGLLSVEDWQASWIIPNIEEDTSGSTPSPFLRKEFTIQKEIREARIYVSALGLYTLYLNGEKVGDQEFTPGWTSYQQRVQYQVYDVTHQLQQGKNCMGAILGDGWYRGYFGWEGKKNLYGDKTALIAQIKITFKDGSTEWTFTDETWKSSTGPILCSDIYNGETYDARLEEKGWNQKGFNDTKWSGVINHQKKINLVASEGPPVKITQIIKPVSKIKTPKGEIVFDLGQNITGKVQIRLKGEKGEKIILHHAEILDKEGNFYTDNLRTARAEDVYICKGQGTELYEPFFTFHGFRYIRISHFRGEIDINDICGKVIHSDMELIGDFNCSNEMVNRLQNNIQWGLRGNFLDVPTDCPQRDERLGWTGDAQVFASTACLNRNTAAFFSKWLKDLSIEQKEDGSIPWVVPNIVKDGGGTGWSDGFGATGWSDAAVIIPWTVYQAYGDIRILENQYNSMKNWTEYMIRHAGDRYIFDYGFHFGDWLAFAEYYSYNYNAPDYGYAGAHTEKDLIATSYFYFSTKLMQKIAAFLGKKEDVKYYSNILPKIKKAFQNEFITPSGRLTSGTQTAYILALSFDLIPEEMKTKAAKRLADDVKYFGHLTTGFLGTPLICQALTENGYPDLAYMLLFNKRYPSWLYPVTMGATTIWERWDGIKPDGTFQTKGMNSFNHYAYGAVGNWLYSAVAGINLDPENPGYKHIILKPFTTPLLNYATAKVHSMYGDIVSGWEIINEKILFHCTIPANTKATIILPATPQDKIKVMVPTEESIIFKKEIMKNQVIFSEVGSGEYIFELTC